jgi:lipopolysaccharide transport system permease protein
MGRNANASDAQFPLRRISPDGTPIAQQLAELASSRDLFALLVRREIQIRYNQTFLGLVWVILQPLVPALIFSVVLGTFAQLPSSGIPYFLFVLSGLVLFGLFAGVVSRAGGSLLSDARLITKVYFPRSILPLATGSAAILDFVVGLALLGVFTLAFGRIPGPEILLLPAIVLLTFVAGMGLGFAIAGLSAYYRDFSYVVPFLLQVLLYSSPVMYSSELVPNQLRLILSLNPLVPLIGAFRWGVLGTPPPSVGELTFGMIGILACALVGLVVFERTSRNLTDVI